MCVVFSYSRKQALADGVLADISELAHEAGFKLPVAMTSSVYDICVQIPEECPWQDATGRLWDVLSVLRYEIGRSRDAAASDIRFTVLMQQEATAPEPYKFKALCHPGDDHEPVITIMLPWED